MILGVDTGGTFTDLVAVGDDGTVTIRKTPSTPRDPSIGILDAVRLLAPRSGFHLVHGTTVATNALLERRGAKTALITTQGCRDVLAIGRQTRSDLYAFSPAVREPLVPRDLRFEVPERVDWRGREIAPLDATALEKVLDAIARQGVEAVAVCFLFSFLEAGHEHAVGQSARSRKLFVSLSSDIAPEFREYERTATVCANAYVGPVMARYMANLGDRLREAGAEKLSIMQSNGGTLRAEEAAELAVKTVLSGPAGGVIAAARLARAAGLSRAMTFDMGGTSTDVSLLDGEPRTVRTGEVAQIPLLTPMLDIHTVGAGGGSIIRVDRGGALRVGPQSAGADPGPVAYGRGDDLTVTDANVLLGRLPGDVRLAGVVPLDASRVRERFEALARQISLSPEQAAEGVLAVVNANMARALRHISTERGYDPSGCPLVAFGGAGGLHACDLASALRIPQVLIPPYPGAFSALGLALADAKREIARSVFLDLDETAVAPVGEALQDLTRSLIQDLSREGYTRAQMSVRPFLEIRYVGQSYALRVDYHSSVAAAGRAFHRAHRERYGYADAGASAEIVTVGVSGTGRRKTSPSLNIHLPETYAKPCGFANVWFGGSWRSCEIYTRHDLAVGQTVRGPAILLQPDATTTILPDWSGTVDDCGNLVLTPRN